MDGLGGAPIVRASGTLCGYQQRVRGKPALTGKGAVLFNRIRRPLQFHSGTSRPRRRQRVDLGEFACWRWR